jgi:hypothetical protein
MQTADLAVVIEIRGGVHKVLCKESGVHLVVRDFDVLDMGGDDIVQIDGRPCMVTVYNGDKSITTRGYNGSSW